MLETIAQIASVLSAITAITTSLRALGKSREYPAYELRFTGRIISSRVDDSRTDSPHKNLMLYLIVTLIWFIMSIIFFSLSLLFRIHTESPPLLYWIIFFILISIIVVFIWLRIFFSR